MAVAAALARTQSTMASLVLHTGWPGLAHCRAVKMAASVYLVFSLSFPLFRCAHTRILARANDSLPSRVIFVVARVRGITSRIGAGQTRDAKEKKEKKEKACARHCSTQRVSSRHAREAAWDCAARADAARVDGTEMRHKRAANAAAGHRRNYESK
jgi:hypothetical protein